MLHKYSRALVDAAVNYKCGTIILVNQKEREQQAKKDDEKGDKIILRNWSYYGLKSKIEYKAKLFGIKVTQSKDLSDVEDNPDDL